MSLELLHCFFQLLFAYLTFSLLLVDSNSSNTIRYVKKDLAERGVLFLAKDIIGYDHVLRKTIRNCLGIKDESFAELCKEDVSTTLLSVFEEMNLTKFSTYRKALTNCELPCVCLCGLVIAACSNICHHCLLVFVHMLWGCGL